MSEETAIAKGPSLIDSVLRHLEFLGYGAEEKSEDNFWVCRHPQRATILVDERADGISITAIFSLTDEVSSNEAEFLKQLNEGNRSIVIGRIFCDDDKALWIQAWYGGPYERLAFGRFFDLWTTGFDQFLESNRDTLSKFLE